MQREEPVAVGGRTHCTRHQADARFDHQRWPAERQLYKVQLVIFILLELALQCREAWKVITRVAIVLVATFAVLAALSVRMMGFHIDPSVRVLVLVFMLIGWIGEWIIHNGRHAA